MDLKELEDKLINELNKLDKKIDKLNFRNNSLYLL